MIKKTFQDMLETMAKRIQLSPLLSPEDDREKVLLRCSKRGHHYYRDGECPCGTSLADPKPSP